MQAHLDLLTERNIAAGMSPNEARNAALRQFGGVEQTQRNRARAASMDLGGSISAGHSLRRPHARRSPAFSSLAIVCLTLGIGTTAAVFSWIEGILFRPYPPVAHQDRMFVLSGTRPTELRKRRLSYPDFSISRRAARSFNPSSSTSDRDDPSIGDRAERARRPGFTELF